MSSEPGPKEVYCIECGEIIKERAELCPECGVRQPVAQQGPQGQPAGGYNTQPQQGQGSGGSQNDVGIIYAHVDANKRKKLLRNLLDLLLALSSAGLYLGLMIGEGLRHYYKLKNGSREPFDPEKHEKTWLV